MPKKKGSPAGATPAPGPPAVALPAGGVGVDNLLSTLKLPRTSVPPQPPTATPPTTDLLVCASPTARTGPVFELPLRRPILLTEAWDSNSGQSSSDFYAQLFQGVAIAGVPFTARDLYFGLDARFSQAWNLTDLTLGDLASTMTLAPQEQLTLEIQTSQRKSLTQDDLDSTESISSSESVTSDKEAVNVARASSKSEGWHVDGTASVNCGYASVSANVGYSQNVTQSNQQTINHVTEATKKSANNLKALHKIDVRGVSESLVQNRMTRVLKNPYSDRSLSVNVFQLLKHFSVATNLFDLRAAMIFRIDSLVFDSEFVLNHADFLRTTLVDRALVDDLPSAIRGAKPPIQSGAEVTAKAMSKLALRYLFNYEAQPLTAISPANLLNLQNQQDGTDQNDPRDSFLYRPGADATNSGLGVGHVDPGDLFLGVITGGISFSADAIAKAYQDWQNNEKQIVWSSGFDTAVRTKASALFATLAYFNAVVRESVPDPAHNDVPTNILDVGDNAILLATALASDLQQQWDKLYPDPLKSEELQAMMSSRNYTEVFRRVPGFLALMRGTVLPLVEPAAADAQGVMAHNQDVFTLTRLIGHLKNYASFYTEQFLSYVSEATANDAVVQFATDAMVAANSAFPFGFDPADFDIDRSFLVGRDVIVPGWAPLDSAALSGIGATLGFRGGAVQLPVPTVVDVELPCDGVHLEVAAGTCILQNVPPQTGMSLDVSVQNAKISAGSSS